MAAPRLALLATLALLLVDPLDAGAYGTTNLKKRKGRSQATKRGADTEYDEHGIPRAASNRAEASDHQRAKLPDRSDPRVKRELQCSICVATVHEVAMALPRRKDRRPKEWEVAEAMEVFFVIFYCFHHFSIGFSSFSIVFHHFQDICLTLETYGAISRPARPPKFSLFLG
jgi:hypothetical protein